tara:strand:+ start:175 stop:1341 length:1167 start_codon:yes stop_codon:yes gene_type:complete
MASLSHEGGNQEYTREQRSKKNFDELVKIYDPKGNRTLFAVFERNKQKVVIQKPHEPVPTEGTIFDVRAKYALLTPDKKLEAKYLGQKSRSVYETRSVQFYTTPVDGFPTPHDRSAEQYEQAVVENFADESKTDAEQQRFKDALGEVFKAIKVLSDKGQFLACRNISRFFNDKAQVLEFRQAAKNIALFNSNGALDEKIEEQKTLLEEQIEELNVDLRRLSRNDDEPAKKRQRTETQKRLVQLKNDIQKIVANINHLYHKRTLAGVVHQADYDTGRAAFYIFRDDNGVGVYELFRQQVDHPEYCLQQFKNSKNCKDAKGYGNDKFSNRSAAMQAAIKEMETCLRADNFKHVHYFSCNFHCTETFQKQALRDNYFHLSPHIQEKLDKIQ